MTEHINTKQSPLRDERINDPETCIDIVFDGSITLWRSGSNLDVILVYFENFGCMELIVYDPLKNQEAPRIYIDFKTLEKHLPREEMQQKIDGRKELFLRRHKPYVAKEIEKSVEFTIMSNYIVSRIAIKSGEPFEVQLQAHFGDTVREDDAVEKGHIFPHLDFIISKPDGLIPIHTEHFSKLKSDEFDTLMGEVRADQKIVQHNFSKANKLLRVVELAASAFRGRRAFDDEHASISRQRWRRSINRVINMNMCERFRKMLYNRDRDALLRKSFSTEPNSSGLHFDGLGPLNGAGVLASTHRSKFENHLSLSKEQRHEKQDKHPPIHILQKSSFRQHYPVHEEPAGESSQHQHHHSDRQSNRMPPLGSAYVETFDLSTVPDLSSSRSANRKASLDSSHLPSTRNSSSSGPLHLFDKKSGEQSDEISARSSRTMHLHNNDHGKGNAEANFTNLYPSDSLGMSLPKAPHH